jgi:hypothetical protein
VKGEQEQCGKKKQIPPFGRSRELTAYSGEEGGIGVADVGVCAQEWRAGSDELTNFGACRGVPPSLFFVSVDSRGDEVERNQ